MAHPSRATSAAALLVFVLLMAPSSSPQPLAPPSTPPATTPAQPPATPPPAFRSAVELVTVDVVVVDSRGRAVPGFDKGDFQVYEDGAAQPITSFQAIELPRLPPPLDRKPVRPRVSTNVGRQARPGRTFVIVFDDIHLSSEQAFRAKGVVNQFLHTGIRDGDQVTLIATGGSAWWSARMPEGRDELVGILKRLDGRYVPDSSPDRVTDYEAMRIIMYDDPDVAYQVERRFDSYGTHGREKSGDRQYADTTRTSSAVGLIDPYVRGRAADVYRQTVERRKITMGAMTRALQSLVEVKGRKAMILVSQGFIYEPAFKDMKTLVEASTRANVPIHFIDTRGLKAMPDFMTAAFSTGFDVQDTVAVLADITREAEGAEDVALDTGGIVVKNTNDLESGILRVSNESQSYYLLGYNPSNTARDGRFRKIEVRLATARAKGLKVRARRGYYAPDENAMPEKEHPKADPEIVKALDSPFEKRDVPIRVSAYAFDEALKDRLRVMIAAEIDIRELELEQRDGRYTGEIAFLIEAQHLQTGEYYRTDEKIEMAMLPETRARLDKTWYTVSREFQLGPGAYQVRVVVRDLATGRLGSVIHDFDVPTATEFRISTPIVSDTVESSAPDGPGAGTVASARPVLEVRRTFTPNATMWVQYSVYGAQAGEATRLPSVSASYEIRRADGSVYRTVEPTRITPTSLGSLMRLSGIRLVGATPGEYVLILHVHDEIAARDVEWEEPFTVTAG
jgi:VWFA-related protein